MICQTCGGLVVWEINLTHTKCQSCKRINNQVPEEGDVDDDVCHHGISMSEECEWCNQEEGEY